jgi:diguanylate cyclase (GGDEF)-like protein
MSFGDHSAYQQLFDQSPQPMWVYDPESMNVLEANEAAEQLYGYGRVQMKRLKVADLDEGQGKHKHQDGRLIAVEAERRSLTIAGTQVVLVLVRDLTEQLKHGAARDSLTGLVTRTRFTERVASALDRSRAQAKRFAVLYFDLDRFKLINDSLGHEAGDRLLVETQRRLAPMLRHEDVLARFGGDEFGIMLYDVENDIDVTRVAEMVLQALRAPFRFEGHEVFTTASMGIAISDKRHERADDLLREADMAMYRAKTLGKARYEVFDAQMQARAARLLQIETDLRKAIQRREFLLHYQPIVSLENNVIVGFEALVRWQHPVRGMISPAEFIPVAEETGMVVSLGLWVLREACGRLNGWQAQCPDFPLTVSVNVSGKQLQNADFIYHVERTLSETGIDPSRLKLEITESAIIGDPATAQAVLTRLKQMNVRLAIDDFGTGYSSLSYLHRFPIDTLKVDRSFVNAMAAGGKNIEIVRTINMLARNLGMDVVAEGVETDEQANQLRELGTEHAQGYFFHRPLAVDAIDQLVAASSLW